MGGRRPYSPRRKDVDAVPEGVAWFMGTLPSAVAFDGALGYLLRALPHLTEISLTRSEIQDRRPDAPLQDREWSSYPS